MFFSLVYVSKLHFSSPRDKAENAGNALLVGLTRLRYSRRDRALWSINGSYLLRRLYVEKFSHFSLSAFQLVTDSILSQRL